MNSTADSSSGMFWSVVVTLGITVVGGIILLLVEYKSGYFQATRVGSGSPDGTDQRNTNVENTNGPVLPEIKTTPMREPPLHAKGDGERTLPKELQSKPRPPEQAKVEPPLVDVTFDHFAATYSTLSERDRSTYIQSLAGKRVMWTAYIREIYLYQNSLYLSDKEDGVPDVNVAVNFTDEMRMSIGPTNSQIQVSGTVEIREPWVVIIATKLSVVR
jgi:hypothetical protein